MIYSVFPTKIGVNRPQKPADKIRRAYIPIEDSRTQESICPKRRTKNLKINLQNAYRIQPAFTLVELMIVVAILGILAAIVIPEFQGYQQKTKETQALTNLRTFREAVQRYYVKYGVAPGYPNNDSTQTPNYLILAAQLTTEEKYLPRLPKNPFNDSTAIQVLTNQQTLAEPTEYNTAYGWLYHPASRTVKLNTPGYFEY